MLVRNWKGTKDCISICLEIYSLLNIKIRGAILHTQIFLMQNYDDSSKLTVVSDARHSDC